MSYIKSWIRKTEIYVQQAIKRTHQQLESIPQIHTFFARRSTKRNRNPRRTIVEPNPQSATRSPQQSPIRILTNPVPQLDRTRDRPPPDPDPKITRMDLLNLLVQPP